MRLINSSADIEPKATIGSLQNRLRDAPQAILGRAAANNLALDFDQRQESQQAVAAFLAATACAQRRSRF